MANRVRTCALAVAVAVLVAGGVKGAMSFRLDELGQYADRDPGGQLRTPETLPFTPTADHAVSRPSSFARATRCGDREIAALRGGGWTMTGHVWSAPRWRIEAFELTPPDAGTDGLALVRGADRPCRADLDPVASYAAAVRSYGYALLDSHHGATAARAYVELADGRLDLVTVHRAADADHVLPAMATVFEEAFSPVPRS